MKFKNIFIFIFLLLITIIIYNSFTKNRIVEEYGRYGVYGRGRALGYGAGGAYGLYHGYYKENGDYGYPLYCPYRYPYKKFINDSSYEIPVII
jgi:hypothetical protein